jgi:transcriptional regulator with XRE-family HTH domain
MDFSDVSARFKKQRGEFGPTPERNHEEIRLLRARILGVLIRDARLSYGSSVAEIAEKLRVPPQTVESWEMGNGSPSLPQLEMLAYSLEIPISHFWSAKTYAAEDSGSAPVATEEYNQLRDRVIGVRIAVARQESSITPETLAKEAGLTADQLAAFEQGRASVPFPELTSLAAALRHPVSYFLEGTGHVGRWLALQEEYARFSDLPDEMRAFVAQLVNQPFIEIAMKLAKMPLQDLRQVGEKILDITL